MVWNAMICCRNVLMTLRSDLSHGKFSYTNQKRISNNSPVDIFEARLPGDHRLVVC